MKPAENKKTLYLIHHSHLDIGYTHTTADIRNRYFHFIKDVISYVKKLSFPMKYTLESWYMTELFWTRASPSEKEDFLELVNNGNIEITAAYANLTDSLLPEIFEALVVRTTDFAREHDVQIQSAMFSDVNGFNPGYAMALNKNGIKYLMGNIHSGHGRFPLERKFIPFWWRLPNGERILCCNNDLYTLGNELGFVPKGSFTDVFQDGIDAKDYNYPHKNEADWMHLAEKRINSFFTMLEEDSHPFDFAVMGIHGTDDDNAMPNPGIIDRIEIYNQKSESSVRVKLVGLTEFFQAVEDNKAIPEFSGDWADWWSDGIGCQVEEFALFKRMQYSYSYYSSKEPDQQKDQTLTNFALFAEHTFNHMLGIHRPQLPAAQYIYQSKAAKIGCLIDSTEDLKYRWMDKEGYDCGNINITGSFKVINPSLADFHGIICLVFDKFDLYTYPPPYRITDTIGNTYSYLLRYVPEKRCDLPHLFVHLKPEESRILTVECSSDNNESLLKEPAVHPRAVTGYEGLMDIHPAVFKGKSFLFDHSYLSEDQLECSSFRLQWDNSGIVSYYDKRIGQELLNGRNRLCAPILEITPERPEARGGHHSTAGRMRKTPNPERCCAAVEWVDLADDTPHYSDLHLHCKLRYFSSFLLKVRLFKQQPKISLFVEAAKNLLTQPHNLYLPIPVITENSSTVKLDRGGFFLKAYEDHLPQSLCEYNTVYGGVLINREDLDINVSMPDSYLVYLRELKYAPSHLMHTNILDYIRKDLFSIPICHQWNVNFFPYRSNWLGLEYALHWGDISDTLAMEQYAQTSIGPVVFKVKV